MRRVLRTSFHDLAGMVPMPEASFGFHTRWLSCFLVDPTRLGCDRDALLAGLASDDIEARPVWKPMHMQPLFNGCEIVGGAVAEDLFRRGFCLPSSSSLTQEDQAEVIRSVRRHAAAAM
jgi:pyridoxal phosphate-dependent aminotransferase EpsN